MVTWPDKVASFAAQLEDGTDESFVCSTIACYLLISITNRILRQVAIRVLCSKPTSIAMERLWNVFGDNLTAKRRSGENKNLCKLVYMKMNAHLVPNSLLPAVDSEVAMFVNHIESETGGDIMSLAKHVDDAAEMEIELCRQLACVDQAIVNRSSSDEHMCEDDEEAGSWGVMHRHSLYIRSALQSVNCRYSHFNNFNFKWS
jgi:hypothetical protein